VLRRKLNNMELLHSFYNLLIAQCHTHFITSLESFFIVSITTCFSFSGSLLVLFHVYLLVIDVCQFSNFL
jgi:hypothetical protein